MADDTDKRSEAEQQLEREIRLARKFSQKEAIARMAGPGAMKGASPISPVQQAETEIGNWLGNHLADAGGSLKMVLHRHLKGSRLLLDNLEQPLTALKEYCRSLLAADNLLREVVRETDVEWGRAMGERPHFEREGGPSHPEDPYTVEEVRKKLNNLLAQLSGANPD